jgi:hypothetical protein
MTLDQPPHQLRASNGGDHRFLHAFAWVRGNAAYEDGQNSGLWVDTSSGCVGKDPYQAGNWVEVIAHQGPENNSASEFISRCPICGESQRNHAGSRYGIITPYEASGPQVRVVALEELARLCDESSDPAARNHPGSGRKLLVFSDSRSGAATLAWSLQEYTAETTMARLVVEAVNCNPAQNLTAQEVLEVCGIPQAQWQGLLALPAAIDGMRAGLGPTPNVLSVILRRKIEENNLSGLLAVSRMSFDNNGNEVPNGDLSLTEAAQYRLIEALCKKGRNGILQRGLLRLSNQNLHRFQMPGMDMPPAQIEVLLSDLVLLLLGRVRLNLPDGFPSFEINQNRMSVVRNGAGGMPFVSKDVGSLLNRTVRIALARHCSFWHQRLQTRLLAADVIGQPAQSLKAELAKFDLEGLRNIAHSVVSNPEKQWLRHLPPQFPMGYVPTPTIAVLRVIRNFSVELAAQLLTELWGPFTNPNGLLVDTGNKIFHLDPMRLLLYPAPGAVNNDAQAGEEEDRELATRTIIPLRVEEHTAQIATERGSAYQRAFADGRVNILSCSTTFEMGVDLGDLNCVFLNGMPPAVANYRQRAGRAGRRPGSSSYALTFLGESSHDRYYWEHPGQLLFGPMDAPKIYLENPLFRARHLRAEAMHDFLDWLSQNNRATDQAAQRFDNNGQPQVAARRRKWSSTGDFFVGVAAGRAQNGLHPVIARFQPLVANLPGWHDDRRDPLQQYIGRIPDVGDPGYQVADDLVWQLLTQADGPIQPYPIVDQEAYQKLGGPHFPDAGDNDPRRRELQHQALLEFGTVQGANPGNISRHQNHLIHEQTVTWLTRGRVLPKYGFPVDVIKLMPDQNDFHGAHVKMERDLRIGLYEYAPGQVVTANKRRFPSAFALAFENGNLVPAGGNAIVRYLCNSCHEPDWGANAQQGQNCRFCGNHGQLVAVNLCRPDAFRARLSTAGSGIPADRGAALHMHTGAFRQGIAVTGTALLSKESNSGTITYINQGPRHVGFAGGQQHQNFSLYHDIRTDIAGWMLPPGLFANGRALQQWSQQNHAGRNRLNAAMKSALQAILRATARLKGIEDRDLGGLVQPGIHQNGELGFVIFDEAVGGGGAVLDLVLTGQLLLDAPRVAFIRRILEHAARLCETCSCGAKIVDPQDMPIERLGFLAMAPQDQKGLRPVTSCYRCLRSHRNQREHELLDRHDAEILLTELLTPAVAPANSRSRQDLVTTDNPPDAFNFLLDDGTTRQVTMLTNALPAQMQWALVQLPGGQFAYGNWMLMQRNTGQRLRLINGVGLEDGLCDPDLGNLAIWV